MPDATSVAAGTLTLLLLVLGVTVVIPVLGALITRRTLEIKFRYRHLRLEMKLGGPGEPKSPRR